MSSHDQGCVRCSIRYFVDSAVLLKVRGFTRSRRQPCFHVGPTSASPVNLLMLHTGTSKACFTVVLTSQVSYQTVKMAHLAATLPESACAFSRQGRSYVPCRPVTGARLTVPLAPKSAGAACHVGTPAAKVRSQVLVNNNLVTASIRPQARAECIQ